MGVGAERDDLAVVGARKIHCGKNHLTGDAASLKAVKNTGVINNHPLWSGALVRHFAHLHRFGTCPFFSGAHPCLKNAAFLGLLVLNGYHSCFVLAVILFGVLHGCFVDAFGNADGTGGANEAAEMATDAFGTEDLRFAFFIKSYRLMAAVGA